MMRAADSDDRQGHDLVGAAQDIRDRARRYAPLYALPGVSDLIRLVLRNPSAAPVALAALNAEIAKNPDKAVGLDTSLFPADSTPQRRPA